MLRLALGLFLLAICSLSLAAQARTAFEVTSVRANTSTERRASMQFTPGGDFNAINQPLRVLLTLAYRIPLFRVEGMPEWFTSERWDFSAKAPAGVKMEPLADVRSELLKSLLEDRFKLKARLVTKDMPAMVLTLARGDGRLGPQMKRVEIDCVAAIAAARAQAGSPAAFAGRLPVCSLGGGSFAPVCGRGVTMAQIVQGFSGMYQRPVVDKTGLDGQYDFDLAFTPDTKGGPGVAFGAACAAPTGDQPALSTAMQEQLGMRIEAGRAPVEVLVIDGAERASEN